MKYDCSKATKICIWYKKEEKQWTLVSMEPSWYIVCGRTPYILQNEDEININKECKIDINHRVIINGDIYILFQYGKENDLFVKVNRI